LIDILEKRGITPVIPPRAHRPLERHNDFAVHRERSLVERIFGKLEGFRATATRDDKLARTFLATIQAGFRSIRAQLITSPQVVPLGDQQPSVAYSRTPHCLGAQVLKI